MADLVFPEDTITGQAPGGDVVSGNGASGFDYKSSELLILGGDTWPGQWDIDPSGAQRDIDKKKPRGSHGHKMRDNGLKGSMVKAIGTLTEEERSQASERIRQACPTEDTGVRTPITITHPDCNECGINVVYIERLKVKSPKTGRDFHTIEMDLGQWFPQPKEVEQPKKEDAPIVSRAEADRIFQGLEQDPGPFGPQPEESFSDAMGRFADNQRYLNSPDEYVPPYTEPEE